MLGWFSAEAERASISKRWRRSGSDAVAEGRTFTAISRPSFGVLRPVDLTHAARADRRDDLVGAEAGTGCERQVRGLYVASTRDNRPRGGDLDRSHPLSLSRREAPGGGRHGRGLPRPRPCARSDGRDQGAGLQPLRRGARPARSRGRGERPAPASGDRDLLRGGRVGRHRVSGDGVRRGRDAARPFAARAAAVSSGALADGLAARGARARARGRGDSPGHQARERHGDGRQPRQAARLRHRRRSGRHARERGRHRSRADRPGQRHRDARLHVARAAPGAAARRALGSVLARRRAVRGDRGAAGFSGGNLRGSDRGDPRGRRPAAGRPRRSARDARRARTRAGPRSRDSVTRPPRRFSRSCGRSVPASSSPRFRTRSRSSTSGISRAIRTTTGSGAASPRASPPTSRACPASRSSRARRCGSALAAGGRGGLRGRARARLPVGALGRVPARGAAPARDVAARRRHDGRDGRLREDRRRSRRDVRHAGPGVRGRGGAPAAGRRRARRSRRAAHRRLRAPRPGPALLSPAREGHARTGALALRRGRRRRPVVRAGARGPRGRARDALSRSRPTRGSSSGPRATPDAPSPPIRTWPSRASGSATPSRGWAATRKRSRRKAARWSSSPRTSTPSTSADSVRAGWAEETKALRLFQRAVELDPRHAFGWLALGWTHLDLGHAPEARWCLEKAVAVEGETTSGPTSGVAGYLGECLRRSGELDAARAACLRGLEAVERSDNMYRDTFRGVCLCALGRTALEQGDTEAAHAAFTQAVAHLRGRPRALGGGHLLVQALAGLARLDGERPLAEGARALPAARGTRLLVHVGLFRRRDAPGAVARRRGRRPAVRRRGAPGEGRGRGLAGGRRVRADPGSR